MHKLHSFIKQSHLLFRVLFFGLWVIGLVFGFFIAMSLSSDNLSLIRSVKYSGVSILGFLISLLLPLLISMVAAWLRLPHVILPLAFLKAFSYSFSATGIALAFGEAGWLIYRLYLFSDSCMCVVFIWFCDRIISQFTVNWKKDAFLSFIASGFIFFADLSLVTPLLELLFKH